MAIYRKKDSNRKKDKQIKRQRTREPGKRNRAPTDTKKKK